MCSPYANRGIGSADGVEENAKRLQTGEGVPLLLKLQG